MNSDGRKRLERVREEELISRNEYQRASICAITPDMRYVLHTRAKDFPYTEQAGGVMKSKFWRRLKTHNILEACFMREAM